MSDLTNPQEFLWENLTEQEKIRSKFTIRTSDRRLFRRCMRKWEFQSSLKKNLRRKGTEQNIHFFFGSAIHYAMEDFHGYNTYGDPRVAFDAYYNCFAEGDLPVFAEEHYNLGIGMLTYYLQWLERHNSEHQFETVWLRDREDGARVAVEPHSKDAYPLVEMSWSIPLGIDCIVNQETDKLLNIFRQNSETARGYTDLAELYNAESYYDISFQEYDKDAPGGLANAKIIPLMYHGTFDRIVKDAYGRWYILDYKTAKGADTNKLDTDDQISAYLWAARELLGKPLNGFIYLQLTKALAQEPKILTNGNLSKDKRQKTTYTLYKKALVQQFGSIGNVPNDYIETLNTFVEQETEEGDKFIRWDIVKRTEAELDATLRNIQAELRIMLLNGLTAYPSPTRDCIWDCPIRDICLSMDRNEDVEKLLLDWEERPRNEDGNIEPWRENLPTTGTPLEEILKGKEYIPEVSINLDDYNQEFSMYSEDER